MDEFNKHGNVSKAAMRADMDRKTASRYLKAGKLPSELKQPRTWVTRKDPFEKDWPYIRELLSDVPDLEAVTLFDHLNERAPGRYQEGQLRTLQRKIKRWRAEEGPPKPLFFQQVHRPGEAMQTDFTVANELAVTIGGEPFDHVLCHPVLPYSNWEWVTVCRSESMAALRQGVQAALFELGHVPEYHQTDNSTAATHDLGSGKRKFNQEYVDLMKHFDMEPRTTGVGEKEQNGDVESLNGAFKRRVKQQLLLRRSSDFNTVAEYESWLQEVARKANRLRQRRFTEEIKPMRPLRVRSLPEFSEIDVRVREGSTIRVKANIYSVPSRLKGELVRVRIYDDRLEIFYAQKFQFTVERLLGKGRHRINYRHVIWSLVRKPGAFERYRYREDLFPSFTFRRAYDELAKILPQRRADLEYLRCLQHAAETMECEVEAALSLLLDDGCLPTVEAVKELLGPERPTIPAVSIPEVDLTSYDALLRKENKLEVAS
jgi:transposase